MSMFRVSRLALIVLLACALTGELAARLVLGLGNPPLYIAHPTIEYMFKPNQDLYRFGNHQHYNEFGMRSDDMASVHQPRRILVLGDSVINGGAPTPQEALATSIDTDATTFFGNVSAGSWGPQNMRAWLEEFGPIGADTAIIVLSAHDLTDLPTFAPLDPQSHPTERPISALAEGTVDYVLPALGFRFASSEPSGSRPDRDMRQEGARQVQLLIMALATRGLKICLLQHPTLTEMRAGPSPNQKEIRDLFLAQGLPVLSLDLYYRAAGQPADRLYRDDIHINERGQERLAVALRDCAATARLASSHAVPQ